MRFCTICRSTLALGLVLALLGAAPARAELVVDITRGFVEPLPIAVTDFFGEAPDEAKVGADISGVIAANLERSGLFRSIDKGAFIQDPNTLRAGPRFGDWRLINAQALVSGSTQVQADGRLRVEFRLWDVFAETQMTGLAYFTTPTNWRRVAHIITDAIYKRLTGEEGYFDTRIVYIAESGPQNRRVKRLSIMDQDGANHRFLTDGGSLVLTPRFSPTTQEITYLSYIAKTPRVYLFNLSTGQQEVLGDFPGMTFAPRFSPDGNKVIMSLARQGNTEIYTMDLRTRKVARPPGHRHLSVLLSGLPGDRVQLGPGRQPAALRHVLGRQQRPAHYLQQGPLCDPGLVAARRPHRLHAHAPGRVLHRRHAPGRQRRAHADQGVPGRGADLGAQRPRSVLLSSGPGRRSRARELEAAHDRFDRLQRTRDRDPDRRLGPGVVPLDSLGGTGIFSRVCRQVAGRAGHMPFVRAALLSPALGQPVPHSNPGTSREGIPCTLSLLPYSRPYFC
jgi:hypothetical protein